MQKHEAKILGEERRELILQWLQASLEPIPARALAEKANVSRQVIVQDISLLKARNEPIIATAQGYMYLQAQLALKPRRIIACCHAPEDTQRELNLMVDYGATVLDVIVEHPIYGELTASLMIRTRKDVEHFVQQIKEKGASLLSELTEGVHLHTIEADSEQVLDEICTALEQENIIISG